MYHPIPIKELSKRQMSRLVNGHPVSIKPHPSGKHSVLASVEQVKKMRRAHMKGTGVRIQLDPYQRQIHHGHGFLSDMVSKALPMVKDLVKSVVLPKAQELVMSKANDAIPALLDKGLNKLQSTKLGSYIPDSVYDLAKDKGSELALSGLESGLNKVSDIAKNKIGSGLKRKKLTAKEQMLVEHLKHKKGAGFLNDLLGNIPYVGSLLKNLDNSLGSGLKKRRVHKGKALYPAGF